MKNNPSPSGAKPPLVDFLILLGLFLVEFVVFLTQIRAPRSVILKDYPLRLKGFPDLS